MESQAATDAYTIQAFCEFLSSTTALTKLQMHTCQELWSCDVLLQIARSRVLSEFTLHPSRHTRVPVTIVNDDWINIVKAAVKRPFECLKKLNVSLHNNELDLLLPHLRNVTALAVNLGDPISKHNLTSLCHLPGLREISIHSEYSGEIDDDVGDALNDDISGVIDGEALIQLAGHCSGLISIWIGATHPLVGPTVSDSVIEEVSQSLPSLEEFRLEASHTEITERSILHFGKHCKSLRSLAISGKHDFIELAKSGSPGMFPKLEELIIRHYHMFHTSSQDFSMLSHGELAIVAERIARLMPECKLFESNNDLEFEGLDFGYPSEPDRFRLDGEVTDTCRILRGEQAQVDRERAAFEAWKKKPRPRVVKPSRHILRQVADET